MRRITPYTVLGVVLFGVMGIRLLTGGHGGDFWQHASAVSELAANLSDPKHPQLAVDAPSPFVTPFALLVALPVRWFDLGAVDTLTASGLVNLTLLLWGLRRYIATREHTAPDGVATIALLLTLFAWGSDAWLYSGFLHLESLGYVLPYPSTFALALSLLAIGVHAGAPHMPRPATLAGMTVAVAVVLVSHPITFLFLAVGLAAQAVTAPAERLRAFTATAAAGGLGVALASAWPYFPVLSLLVGQSHHFDGGNTEMFDAVLARAWPTALVLPLALVRLTRLEQRSSALLAAALAAIYVGAALTGRDSFGRVLSALILVVHIAAAGTVAALVVRLREWTPSRRALAFSVGALAVAVAAAGPMERAVLLPPAPDPDLSFFSRHAHRHDVVLTDFETGRLVGAFGVKAISANVAFPFIADADTREQDVRRFFDAATAPAARQHILTTYDVDHVLLVKQPELPWQAIRESHTGTWGRVVHEDAQFVLLSRNGGTPAPASVAGR